MTNMDRRIRRRTAWFLYRLDRIPTFLWRIFWPVLKLASKRNLRFTKKAREKKFGGLRIATTKFKMRVNSIAAELAATSISTARRSELLAEAHKLQKEANRLNTLADKPTVPMLFSTIVLLPAACHMMDKFVRRQRRAESFRRLMAGIENETFYSDLLLWFVLARSYDEALVGDLKEEYLLRESTHGEADARAWYRRQAVTTAGDYFWSKVGRLVSIATLIDLFSRWFRK